MKKLSILFAIVATLCFTVVSCDKESNRDTNTVTPTALTDAPDPSEDEEVFDIEDDSEPLELEERASNAIIIDSVKMNNPIYLIDPTSCYFKTLNNVFPIFANTATKTFYIHGKKFGESAGSVDLTVKVAQYPITVTSWSDSLIVFTCSQNIDINLKKFKFKVLIMNTLGKKKSKTITLSTMIPFSAVFPTARWEVDYQRSLIQKPAQYNLPIKAIDSTYAPQIGDVLSRSSTFGLSDVAVIYNIESGKKTKYKIYERNQNCRGSLKKKTYYYIAQTGFSYKAGENSFTHYKR